MNEMFVWKDTFSVGIEEIDNQHKRLFELGRDIYKLSMASNHKDKYEEIAEVIYELDRYTAYHFETEEGYLEKYGYEDLENHQEEHRLFLEKLHDVAQHDIDEDQDEFIKYMLMFLLKWIMKHINGTDFKYRDLLQKHMK